MLRIKTLPYFSQETSYTCGPACGRMLLAKVGIGISERDLGKRAGTTEIHGTYRDALIRALSSFGLAFTISDRATVEDILRSVRDGVPALLAYEEPSAKESHFAVLRGLQGKNLVLLHDPAHGRDFPLRMDDLAERWLGHHVPDPTRGWLAALRGLRKDD